METDKSKKVLVIGGAGYIGSHVVLEFQRAGYAVSVVDNFSTGCKENIQIGTPLFEGTILDIDFVESVISKEWDCVVHLAALKAAGESGKKMDCYATNNITGTINILNAMAKFGVKSFVFSSSAAIFGEPQYLPIDEDHPKEPINFYGFTKLEVERLLSWYSRYREITFVSLRYFNACGYSPDEELFGLEQEANNLLPIIMETAIGWRERLQVFGDDYDTADGTCVRDYIHVTDLALAHVLACQKIERGGESDFLNLGSESGISVKEMIHIAQQVTGVNFKYEIAPRREGDPSTLIASSKRAYEQLGWKPSLSDAKTLIETSWKVYQRHANKI